MKAALLKELRLVVHPSTYFIVVLGALVLIPSWMYGAIFIYGVLVAFFNGMNAREMHDLEYSFSLPLSRASMAKARILTMTGIEMIMLAIMIIFIALRGPLGINGITPPSEAVGTAANLYLVALGFITFGMFNLVFYPLYYRNPLKVGLPFIIASIPAALCIAATVVLPYLPLRPLVSLASMTQALNFARLQQGLWSSSSAMLPHASFQHAHSPTSMPSENNLLPIHPFAFQ